MRKTLLAALASLVLAGAAAAASAPGATTGSATGIGTGRATLNGSVASGGLATSWRFEYGTTSAYGSSTAAQTVGAGVSTQAVSATVANLAPGHTYHFRLVASNSAGMSVGADASLTTAGSAPAATTLAASAVGIRGARLNGSVDPKGFATTWYFAYGTTTGYGARTPAQGVGAGSSARSVSVAVSGLAAGTAYHFELVASSAAGTSVGGDVTLTTIGAPGVEASAAQSVAPTSATLTGTVNPNGEATSYQFDYGTSTAYGSTTPAVSIPAGGGARAVSAAVTGLAPATGYHFRLVASSKAGTATSNDVTVSTPASVVLNPAATRVVAGRYVDLSGSAFGGQPGVSVTILAQPFGSSSASPVATVLTGASGQWTYPARPSILTTYSASAEGGTSPSLQVGVAPAVTLRRISGGRLLAHVSAGSSLVGRIVQLQRLEYGRWKTLKRARLDVRSSVRFSVALLPVGRSVVRIAMSVNQAGPGYLGAFSRQLATTRERARRS